MPVNEFEKQVQQKMDELQLRPSPEVWVEVEKRIRKEKKRRRVIFWWLLPVLLAGGLAIYYTNKPENKTHNALSNKSTNTSSKFNQGELANKLNEQKEKSTTTLSSINNDDLLKETTVTNNTNNQLLLNQQASVPVLAKSKAQGLLNQGNEPRHENKEHATAHSENLLFDTIETSSVNPNTKKQPAPFVTGSNAVIKDKTVDSVLLAKVNSGEPKKEDDPVTKEAQPIQVKKRSKWRIGFEAAPGLSNTKEGKLFNESKLMYAGDVGTAATSSFAPLAPPISIASPSKSFSFQFDVFAQKEISKRFSIKAGLNYSYLASKLNVGSKIMERRAIYTNLNPNLTINSYYSPAESAFTRESYTNRYHLLGLSSGISYNLIRSRSFNVQWENTFTISALVGTNALLFDKNLRGYYHDRNAFRKTHIMLSTGFTVPVFEKKTYGIKIHPSVSFGPGSVLKKNSDTNPHFINYGVGMRISLH